MFGTGTFSTWSQGDVTYDGQTNVFDLIAIDGAGVFGAGPYLPTATVAAVPEPGTRAFWGIGGLFFSLVSRGLGFPQSEVFKNPFDHGLASR